MHSDLLWLLQTVALYFAINVGLRAILRQPLLSAAAAFWGGWAFLLVGGIFVVEQGWRTISLDFVPYLKTLFDGALAGFAIGAVLGAMRKPRSYFDETAALSNLFLNKYSGLILLSLFVVGSLFLAYRISLVGFNINYLSNVRGVYNQKDDVLLLQIGSQLSVMAVVIIILMGLVDAREGINVRKILTVVVAGAPLGLANGGRIFLLSYFMAYIGSFLLCRAHVFAKRMPLVTLPEATIASGALLILLSIFAVMGHVRGGYGDNLNVIYTVLVWPVSTLEAMDSWVKAALYGGQTYGLNTLGWIADVLSRVNLLDFKKYVPVLGDAIQSFKDANNSAAVIPRSILPDLIFDFGYGNVFASMMAVAGALEFATSRYVARGIFLHVLAVECLIASFSTIQNSVLSPGFAVAIFWGAVFSLAVKRRVSAI